MVTNYSHKKDTKEVKDYPQLSSLRECPRCAMMTLAGIPGGRDSHCNNCGFKDPCCSD